MKNTLLRYRSSVIFFICTIIVIVTYGVICYKNPSSSTYAERLTLNYPNTQYEGVKNLLLALITAFSTIVAVLITIETNNNKNFIYQQNKRKLINKMNDLELHLNNFNVELSKFRSFSIVEASLYSDMYTHQDNPSIQTISINSELCQHDEVFRIRSQIVKLYQLMNLNQPQNDIVLSMHFMKKSDFIKVHKLSHDTIFIINTEYAEYIAKILIDNDIDINSHNYIISNVINIIDLYNKEQQINEETITKFKTYLNAIYTKLMELQSEDKIKINFSIPDPYTIFEDIESSKTFGLENITFYNHDSMFSYIVCISILKCINESMNDYKNSLGKEVRSLKAKIDIL